MFPHSSVSGNSSVWPVGSGGGGGEKRLEGALGWERWSHSSLPRSLPSSPSGKPHLGLGVRSDLLGMGEPDPLRGAGSPQRERLAGFAVPCSTRPESQGQCEMRSELLSGLPGGPPVGELMVGLGEQG